MSAVRVVVPHFRQQVQLDRLLAALAVSAGDAEIVVADDGSPVAERPMGLPDGVEVRHQEDRGFRAAAARNLGAAGSDAEVLVFLDADMVPGPGWLGALSAPVRSGEADLVVGRRRHARLDALTPDQALAFAAAPEQHTDLLLAGPEWLDRGYRETSCLRRTDGEGWRLVISACLAVRRSTFEALGGFDPAFGRYGGEDWDLAYRALNRGAVLRHEPDAVAWHDGPDWAGRDAGSDKVVEHLELAARIPRSGVRPAGWIGGAPRAIVRLPPDADVWATPWARCLSALWRADPDVVVLAEDHDAPGWLRSDPRWCHQVPAPMDLDRCRLHVRLDRPVGFEVGAVAGLADRVDPGGPARCRVTAADGSVVVDANATRVVRPLRPGDVGEALTLGGDAAGIRAT